MYRLLSARRAICSINRRQHKQSAYQLGDHNDPVTGKQILCGAIIAGLLFASCFIDGYGKPDPKNKIVEVRK